ncbi:MAG: hypothetical protein JSW37_14925, partial [Anaerolineales bacterium]
MIPRPDRMHIDPWWSALWHSVPVTALVAGLMYYWFGVADRYTVFLYDHDMGPRVPDTSPFSPVTSSRYWMAGLVASGAVMVLYAAASWILARWPAYRPPRWWRVWVCSAIPLVVAILAITMTVNQPTLPPPHAARVTLATLVGLALALMPGKWAAERPSGFALLAVDGLALMMVMTGLAGVEYVAYWLASGGMWRVRMLLLGLAAGLLCLSVASWLWVLWRRSSLMSEVAEPIPNGVAVLGAGLAMSYLFMPLVHHIAYTDGYYYITDMDNFLARNGVLQAGIFLVAAALAVGATRVRQAAAARWAQRTLERSARQGTLLSSTTRTQRHK